MWWVTGHLARMPIARRSHRINSSYLSKPAFCTWDPNDPCCDWKRPCFGGFKPQNRGQTGSRYEITCFFPTCQVRVVRFYVSLSSSFSSSSFSSSFSSSSSSSPPLVLSCAGPQRRSCVCSVPRRTSTAILCVQCSAPDLNGDPVSAVFRAGPQPRSCECRVPRRTSTAIL